MKTMKKNSEVKRVKENLTQKMKSEGWEYCPKSEWKKTVTKISQNEKK
jgi:hypothetical protein